MTEKFRDMIKEDIQKCEDMTDIEGAADLYYGEKEIFRFYLYLVSCYGRYIKDIEANLSTLIGTTDEEFHNCVENIKIVKRKLELFLEEEEDKVQNSNTEFNVTMISEANNKNNISNNIAINITFEQARENIQNMTALPKTEIEDILKKINELEDIIESKDKKSQKWENAKGIIKWVADKGVDVGINLLPLLLQIQ